MRSRRREATSEDREAPATDKEKECNFKKIASLYGTTVDMMGLNRSQCPPPDVVMGDHHQAEPLLPPTHWKNLKRSAKEKMSIEKETTQRQWRNLHMREKLAQGKSVFYRNKGTSLWPLVQDGDGCLFHPIQAVTAMGGQHSINKTKSDIDVGDIVFCQVQNADEDFYAHIVIDKELRLENDAMQTRYYIGSIEGKCNGWCKREHIYGILQTVGALTDEGYLRRPKPRPLYGHVKNMVAEYRWSPFAADLCAAKLLVPPTEG